MEVTRDEAGPGDCKEPGNEGPGCRTMESGYCPKGGGKPSEVLTGGNRVWIWSGLQNTLVANVEVN